MKHIATLAVAALAMALPAQAATVDDFVGKWGLASYFVDKDAAQTELAARAQCHTPYVIAKGPGGGVMLHLPDETHTSEMQVKTSFSASYIGPKGEAGGPMDREILRSDKQSLVLKWIDPAVGKRYGIMVFVRCGP